MTLLFLTIILGAATIALLVTPFWRRGPSSDGSAENVYKAQLAEIDREEAAGLMSGPDARMARIEVQRRLLKTDEKTPETKGDAMSNFDRLTILGIAAIVLIGASITYATIGHANQPSTTHAATDLSQEQLESALADPNGTANGVAAVETAIARIEARLKEQPGDIEGWRLLGWSKFRIADYEGASRAYAKAVDLQPDDVVNQSAYAESLIRAGGGVVSPDALAALNKAKAIDPSDARTRFLLGLQKEQSGDAAGALSDWIDLLASAEPGAEWFNDVRARVLELSASSGIDVTDRVPAPRAGPSSDQVAGAEAMSEADRMAMIEGMVASLDARLRADPTDLEGWVKLIKSRRVLREDDLAQDALNRARTHFSDNPSALAELEAAANFTPPLQ